MERELDTHRDKRAYSVRQAGLKLRGQQKIFKFGAQNCGVGQRDCGGCDTRADDHAANALTIPRCEYSCQDKEKIERGYALYGKQEDQDSAAAPLGANRR